ncbi:MAG TPA: methyltransferase domain-containing protein [Ktedonobacterales bacterium]|jgi:ubiquinone/menaquinone biosynthesis C-methylase UbiE/catechol 2,3-dioxygenase-like lactoylglutathione lyase family enzyme|nr:methyltransferase domain-containing protein [Ktedonobacterales bacterium]
MSERVPAKATTPLTILGLDHVQVAMPRGEEQRARAFYGETLGLPERAKPVALANRGGVWFTCGDQELHLGVEDGFQPQRKGHPAFRVDDLGAMRERLEAAGAPISEDVPLPGRLRFETRDPFGNRLEFQQLLATDEPGETSKAADMADPDAVGSADEAAHERVRQTFAPNAEAYVSSASHASGADLARMVEVAAPHPGDVALDVSTGGGHVALALAPHVARMVASDLTPRMLMVARAHLTARGATNVDYVIADAERLPFLDESFDLVTVRIAPHHYPDAGRAVREMARVVKRGGRLVIIDNIAPADSALDALLNDWERRRDPSHIRSHTLATWRDFITQAGLRPTHEEVGRKAVPFAPWAERTQMPATDRDALEADMLAAPAEAQAFFAISRNASGGLESWTMEYALLRAERET